MKRSLLHFPPREAAGVNLGSVLYYFSLVEQQLTWGKGFLGIFKIGHRRERADNRNGGFSLKKILEKSFCSNPCPKI